MKIRKSWRRLVIVSTWLALTGAGDKLTAQPAPAVKPLTVERIAEERERDKSLPRNLIWSPDGKSLSYIVTAPKVPKISHGPSSPPTPLPASQIWSIDAGTGKEKLLVSSADLTATFGSEPRHFATGQEDEAGERRRQLMNYAWAPGGHSLLLASSVALAWFDLDTHSSRAITTDGKNLSSVEISPDGHFVSYIQGHTLWISDIATGTAHAFSPPGSGDLLEGEPDWAYRHELGLRKAYWWSPDSSSIAWLETDDHAVDKYLLRGANGDERSIAYPKPGRPISRVRLFVGTVSGGKALPIDLGTDANVYIPRMQWLPDGKHLAVERLGRSQKTLDLLRADPATGAAPPILTEKDVYWINLDDDLHFLKDSNRFLWSSERSGYRHLYLYDISGHQLAQLTQGNWEVNSLAEADEAAGIVYFTATEASPLERQLYRVKLDGSGFGRITKEKGTHEVLFPGAGDAFLDTWSDHVSRPRQSLRHADGNSIGAIGVGPSDLGSQEQSGSFEFLTMKTHLGLDLNAWMMKPPGFDPKIHYPVILYLAGGPGEQGVRDIWGGDINLWFFLMAQKGYIIFALDTRGTTGRGHLFEEPIHLRFSAAEMADVRDGVMYLQSQSWIDKDRLGICGWDYGGFLALHGMLDRPLHYKAGFAGSPVTDWHLYDAVFAERYLEDPVRNQDGWLSSTPLENTRNLNAPLLLAQATEDEKVHQENSLSLLDELLEKGKYADILLFPDRRSLFEDKGARSVFFGRLTDFFVKNL
jgi:dipeptidyl-peptidase-4